MVFVLADYELEYRGCRNFYSNPARRFTGLKRAARQCIEAVLWLPLFFAHFGLMTDAAMVFNGHSRVMRVVQDANRNLSVGRLADEAETEAYIVAALSGLSQNATASTTIVSGVATTTAFMSGHRPGNPRHVQRHQLDHTECDGTTLVSNFDQYQEMTDDT